MTRRQTGRQAKRQTLPGAAELFRTTSPAGLDPATATSSVHPGVGAFQPPPPGVVAALPAHRAVRRVGASEPSKRERHEEKITVYCTAEELLALESARLVLRGDHGMPIDRGRIVREAIAVVLADLDAKGADSILVRRLRES